MDSPSHECDIAKTSSVNYRKMTCVIIRLSPSLPNFEMENEKIVSVVNFFYMISTIQVTEYLIYFKNV